MAGGGSGRKHGAARGGGCAAVDLCRRQLSAARHGERRRVRPPADPPDRRAGTRAPTRSDGSPPPACPPATPIPRSSTPRRSSPAPTATCGSPTAVGNSIGRITTGGTVTNFTDPTIDARTGIAAGRRRQPLVHQPTDPTRSAHHPRRRGHQLHRHRTSDAPTAYRRDPTATSGSPTGTNNSIGRITDRRRGRHTSPSTGLDVPCGDHRRVPTATSGSPTPAATPSDASPRRATSPRSPDRHRPP